MATQEEAGSLKEETGRTGCRSAQPPPTQAARGRHITAQARSGSPQASPDPGPGTGGVGWSHAQPAGCLHLPCSASPCCLRLGSSALLLPCLGQTSQNCLVWALPARQSPRSLPTSTSFPSFRADIPISNPRAVLGPAAPHHSCFL